MTVESVLCIHLRQSAKPYESNKIMTAYSPQGLFASDRPIVFLIPRNHSSFLLASFIACTDPGDLFGRLLITQALALVGLQCAYSRIKLAYLYCGNLMA